ncbi:DUF2637 domain-containing protein [Actinoallomurus acaciae]|uniref:DUF2637 domain-containing protein n=1 Tax=Actinoallomurus acaciae TaxID=502577 RepID=A0ABV5YFJ3_9ACTN
MLAGIAGAGSFTHIRDTANEHGQHGPMAWAIAVCIDLTCVMAARERQRDRRTHRTTRRVSWPSLVLAGGVLLSLAANLAQADSTVWGWLTAATPCGAFLVAVSMLERRSSGPRPAPSPVPPSFGRTQDGPVLAQDEPPHAPAEPLVAYARRIADEHQTRHDRPITRDALRARLGVSNQLASDLLRQIRTT